MSEDITGIVIGPD